MGRLNIDKKVETEILTSSKRRCCLCVGIDGNYSPRPGQIAHLDHNNSNNKVDNLAWFCLEHHTMYDSKTSQHKNYTLDEVKYYRNTLYKYLEANPNIDKPKAERLDKTKPYCVRFNGITSYVRLENTDFLNLQKFSIECVFKLHDERYTGLLFSLDNYENNSFYCLTYYSNMDKAYPGELHLRFICHEQEIDESLASITIDKLEWKKLCLIVSPNKLILELGNQRISSFHKLSEFKLKVMQIGGKSPNYGQRFLSCYMSQVKVFDNDNDQIINDLVFDYGQDYLLALPKIKGMLLINMPNFYQITE